MCKLQRVRRLTYHYTLYMSLCQVTKSRTLLYHHLRNLGRGAHLSYRSKLTVSHSNQSSIKWLACRLPRTYAGVPWPHDESARRRHSITHSRYERHRARSHLRLIIVSRSRLHHWRWRWRWRRHHLRRWRCSLSSSKITRMRVRLLYGWRREWL